MRFRSLEFQRSTAGEDVLEPDIAFIQKPFAAEELAPQGPGRPRRALRLRARASGVTAVTRSAL